MLLLVRLLLEEVLVRDVLDLLARALVRQALPLRAQQAATVCTWGETTCAVSGSRHGVGRVRVRLDSQPGTS